MLAIPYGPKLKKMSLMESVRNVLARLQGAGYSIRFTPKAILGKKNGREELLFVRRESVTIPPRPFLRLSAQDLNEIHRKLENAVKKMVI